MIQLSLQIPDRPGELARVVSLLGARNIDVKALYVCRDSATPPAGFVRMIVTDPASAVQALQQGGMDPIQEQVVVAAVDDHPGGLAAVLTTLARADINLTYAYGFVSKVEGRALSVLGVEDATRGAEVLKAAGVKLVGIESESDLADYVGGVWNW